VALVCSSQKKSDRFYKDLLGLETSEPRNLPISLSKAIFNVDAPLIMINYRNETVHFEIFITGNSKRGVNPIAHVCIEIDNLETFLKKCDDLKVEVSRIPKGDRSLTFIRDFDGNLFEIKHRQSNE
jgi:catechol 2,3-dioxygenase-like lactoylglutathione lyase family enzyme